MGNCAATQHLLDSVELTIDKRYCKSYRHGLKKTHRSKKTQLRRYGYLGEVGQCSSQDIEAIDVTDFSNQFQYDGVRLIDAGNEPEYVTYETHAQNVSFSFDDQQSLTVQLTADCEQSHLIDALLLEDVDHPITTNRRSRLVAKQAPSADDRDYYYNGDDDVDHNIRSTGYFRSRLQPEDDEVNRLTMSSPIEITPSVDKSPTVGRQSISKRYQAGSASTSSSWRRRGRHQPSPAEGRTSTRTAPRLSVVSRGGPVYTSTGSSTSGVDVSVSSSRSELIVQMRNGQPTTIASTNVPLTSTVAVVTASSVDADCEDNVDEEDVLAIYRSASFRCAIERGNSTRSCGDGSGSAPSLNYGSIATQSLPVTTSSFVSTFQGTESETKLLSAPMRTPSPRASSLVKQFSTGDANYPTDALDLSSTTTTDSDKGLLTTTVQVGADHGVKTSSSSMVDTQDYAAETGAGDEISDSDVDAFSSDVTELTVEYSSSPGGARRRCLSTLTEEELTDSQLAISFTQQAMLTAKLQPLPLNGSSPGGRASPNTDDTMSNGEPHHDPGCGNADQSTSQPDVSITAAKPPLAKTHGGKAHGLSKVGMIKRKSMQEMRLQLNNSIMNDVDEDECKFGSVDPPVTSDSDQLQQPSVEQCDETNESTSTKDEIKHFLEGDDKVKMFPSLTAQIISRMRRESARLKKLTPEDSSLQQTEDKFATLSLAFKTDRQTLDKRLELHSRSRDVAEANIQKELDGVKHGLRILSQLCCTSSECEVLTKTQQHVDVLEQSIARLSSQAELHGAVHQEMRISEVVDIMVLHVENLKRTYQKEHAELEEARKSVIQSKSSSGENGDRVLNRGNSVGVSALKVNRRRASIAVLSKVPLLPIKTDNMTSSDDSVTRRSISSSALDSFLLSKSISSENETSSSSPNFTSRSSKPFLRQSSSPSMENRFASFSPSSISFTTSVSGGEDEADDIEAEYAAFRRRQEERQSVEQQLPQQVPSVTDCGDVALRSARRANLLNVDASDDADTGSDLSPAVMAAIASAALATTGGECSTGIGTVVNDVGRVQTGGSASRSGRYRPRLNGPTAGGLTRVIEQDSDEEDGPIDNWTPPPPRRRSVRPSIIRSQSTTNWPKTSSDQSRRSRYLSLVFKIFAVIKTASIWILDRSCRLFHAVAESHSGRQAALLLFGIAVFAMVILLIRYWWLRLTSFIFTRSSSE